jgi:hypothetical protein
MKPKMSELERTESALKGLHRMKAEIPPGQKTTVIDKMIAIAEQRVEEAKKKLADGEAESKT